MTAHSVETKDPESGSPQGASSEGHSAHSGQKPVKSADRQDKHGEKRDKREQGEKRDKRERILAAAEKIFAQHGFYNARVAEIARTAGVADGTIYLYFKSKDDLLISLFETRMQRVNESLAAAVAGASGGAEDKLRAFIGTYLAMIKENPHVAEVLTIELRQSSKFMKEYANPRFAEMLKQIATVIDEGQKSGDLDDSVPAPIAARMLFGVLDELALAWLLGSSEKFDIVRAADWVGAMTMSGLKRRSES